MADPQKNAEPGRGVSSQTTYDIHRGSALEPQRRAIMDPSSGEVSVGRPSTAAPGTPMGPLPSDPIPVVNRETGVGSAPAPHAPFPAARPAEPPPSAPPIQSSPPPANPAEASDLAALREQNQQLQRALGDQSAKHEREMAELALRIDASQVRPPQLPQFQLDPKLDPSEPVTNAQLLEYTQKVIPHMSGMAEAHAIRASWDVTPHEEADILAAYPQFNSHPEPARTHLILRAAKLRRPAQQASSSTPATAATENSAQIRPGSATVPHVEAAGNQIPEPSPRDDMAEAQRAYQEARAMSATTPQEALKKKAAMRAAWDRINKLQGLTEEQLQRMGIQQKL